MNNKNNIRKLCVGVEDVTHLKRIQEDRYASLGFCCAYTTLRPKREAEIIENGSLYWIIKGKISARQKIFGFESYMDEAHKKRTIIVLDKDVIETVPYPHRPFQGWRYLTDEDCPKDLDKTAYKDIPEDALAQMQDLGIL